MNQMAKKIHMKSTHYTNPHGLADKANHSTALDLSKLAYYALKDPIFKEVVKTQEYRSWSFLPRKNIIKLPCKDFSEFKTAEQVPFSNPNNIEYVHFT